MSGLHHGFPDPDTWMGELGWWDLPLLPALALWPSAETKSLGYVKSKLKLHEALKSLLKQRVWVMLSLSLTLTRP